ncbi:hypothetical protein [Pendulispora albinea]|uniref:Lipoprotein n=1 Tax=Pendulispora albinea TaxID=2741071 RepID=A0ABZ2LPC0_9BACT
MRRVSCLAVPVTLFAFAASLVLGACTHDYDVFKPRGDAGPDGSRPSRLETANDADDADEPPSE